MRKLFGSLPQFERSVFLYMGMWCAVGFGYFGIVGVLLNLFILRLGYGPGFIGLLNGSGQLVWALFSFPAIAIGARFGLKNALISGMVLVAAGTFLLVAAGSLPLEIRTAGLILAWMISWIGASLMTVNSAPYLMAITQAENRGLAFSIQQSTLAFTALIGSLVAGLLPGWLANWLGYTLDQPNAYRLALLLAPVAYLIGGFAVSRIRPAEAAPKQASKSTTLGVPYGLMVFLVVFIFLQVFSDGSLRSFFNVYLDSDLGISTAQIGAVMGFAQILPVFFALLTPMLLARMGCQRTLVVLSVAAGSFMLLLSGVPNIFAATVSFIAMAGLGAMMTTARIVFSQEMVEPQWRTTASAVSTVGVAVAWASAAGLGGILASTLGLRAIFFAGAISALLAAGLMTVRILVRRQIQVDQVRPDAGNPVSSAIPVSGKSGDD